MAQPYGSSRTEPLAKLQGFANVVSGSGPASNMTSPSNLALTEPESEMPTILFNRENRRPPEAAKRLRDRAAIEAAENEGWPVRKPALHTRQHVAPAHAAQESTAARAVGAS